MKKEIINSILMDDLKRAELLIAKKPAGFEMLSSLLKKVKDKPVPLKALKSKAPGFVAVRASYACSLRCEMCNSGFHDRTFLYDDYRYFLPEQFDRLSSWINSASNVFLVGEGETLNSPYVNYFLSKITGKHSTIVTNGIPLTGKKIQSFINVKLNVLLLSFDGKLSLGHGKGTEKYIQQFWKKVKLIQKIKKDFNSILPVVKLTIAVANENLNNIEEIIETASKNGITIITLSLMTPLNKEMYRKSIFVNFEESKNKINSIISKWNKKGLSVSTLAFARKLRDSRKVCPFIDNWLLFHGRSKTLEICCDLIEMPLYISDLPQIEHWNSFPFRYFRYLHFCSNQKELPIACKKCVSMNLKEYSQTYGSLCDHFQSKKRSKRDHLALYTCASRLKQNNLNSRAEKMFLEVLKLKADPELKGKVYFHLGEIELRRKNYRRALRLMKLSVQHCFNHSMAFAYLNLLMMLLGEKKMKKRRNKFKIVVPE